MLFRPSFLSLISFLLTSVASSFQGHAGEPASGTGPASAVTAPEDPAAAKGSAGLVWRVSGGKSPMFLAGSFHLLRASDYPLPAAYEQAWRESSQVVFEIAPGEMEKPEVRQKVGSLSLLKEGRLSDRISADTWKNLSAWAAETSTPESMLQRLQPWMAGLTVSLTAFDRMGYKPEFGMEKHFAARLKAEGKTSTGLETATGQITLFTTLSTRQQEDMLRQALDEVKNPQVLLRTSAAWHAGDAGALHASMHESFADFRYLEKILLTDRNAAWIPVLEKCLQGDQATLVMVGAGHLCGPGSVVDLLAGKGYRPARLIPVQSPAAPAPVPAPIKKTA